VNHFQALKESLKTLDAFSVRLSGRAVERFDVTSVPSLSASQEKLF